MTLLERFAEFVNSKDPAIAELRSENQRLREDIAGYKRERAEAAAVTDILRQELQAWKDFARSKVGDEEADATEAAAGIPAARARPTRQPRSVA